MKKTVAVVLFTLLTCLAIAQDTKSVFGLKTGLNVSILSTSINSDPSSRTGFHLGAYVKVPLSEKVFFRPELYYSGQGQKDDYGDGSTTTTKLNYLNIPVLFEMGRKVSFQAGPQLGFLLAAHEKGTIDGDKVNDDLKEFMKGTDFSLVLGMGFQPQEHFNFGVRLNLGVSDIFDIDAPGFPSVKNRVFHFYVAYSF